MKFTIQRAAFLKSLNTVARAITAKNTIPILSGIKISTSKDGLVLTGSDADISIETRIAKDNADNGLEITDEGSIVLNASLFINIVKKLPDDKMTLEIIDGLQTKITSGQSDFTISGLDASNYPHLPEIDTDKAITLSGDVFKEIIEQTVIAVSTQESRPILTGVHFVLKDQHLLAVATDSHRLSQRKVNLSDNLDQDYDIIVPGKSLTELQRMISDHQDIKLRISENQVLFGLGDTAFYSRLLEGNYPDTSRLIPDSASTTMQLQAPVLLAAIERASLLSHASRNNVVKLTMNPEQKGVKLTGDSPDIGNVEEELTPEEINGDNLEISFNPDYMKDALRSFGKSMINISFTSPLRPFTLLPSEDQNNNFVQLITPVRTF